MFLLDPINSIEWKFTFDSVTDIPTLEDKEAIMDWISESPEMAELIYKLQRNLI